MPMNQKKKNHHILITALFFLFLISSCGNIKNYPNPNFPKFSGNSAHFSRTDKNDLKVVSFNIKFALQTEQAIKELATFENLQNSDIILLQEMDEKSVSLIARKLDLNYIYFPACLQSYDRDFGNAILSKMPIRNDFKIILPHKNPINRQQRIASGADLILGDKIIRVYSIHTEVPVLSIEDRISQVNTVIQNIPDSIDYVIVGGDFNTILPATVEKIDYYFEKKGLYQATEDIEYTTQLGPYGIIHLKMDHIFVRGLKLKRSGTCLSSKASDHFPIWANFRLN
jgi:endonuclease/exonuclease/phosphatase family metal-dependent hydrolase